jgi:2-alkyl-3-oxoalkanoate reductase
VGGLVVAKVVITGAAGFIGGSLASAYQVRGDEVVGLDLTAGSAHGVRWVPADISVDGAWSDALDGADLVIHTAAIVAEAGDRSRFVAVNVGGTRRVCVAAADRGVGRVVHLSSIVVYGPGGTPGAMLDEQAPVVPSGGPYTDTKIGAEHAAQAVALERGLAVTIVRPGDVYGPGSVPWVVRPLELMRRGRFPLIDGGRGMMSPIHVDDLVSGIVAAGDHPDAAGRTYNLAGPPVPAAVFFDHHARHLGVELRSVPRTVAAGAARLLGLGGRALGRDVPFSAEAIEYVTHAGGYAIERARAELGWSPEVELGKGLERTFAALG